MRRRNPSSLSAWSRSAPWGLRVVDREQWDDGRIVTFLSVPMPQGRKPMVPSRALLGARRSSVPIVSLLATQTVVTQDGVLRYLRHPRSGTPPLVYETDAGRFVADGHHRIVAAIVRGQESIAVDVVDWRAR